MIFKDSKVYDVLKWITMVGLPAYIWGFPYAEAIGATLAAITTFMGALLGISSVQYAKQNAIGKEAK